MLNHSRDASNFFHVTVYKYSETTNEQKSYISSNFAGSLTCALALLTCSHSQPTNKSNQLNCV